jgi:hypothetical protein
MAASSIIIDFTGASLRIPDTNAQFSPGHVAHGDYGGKYLYGKANATFAAGDVIYFDKDFIANPITTTNSPRGAKVAVAKMAMTSGQWGFFQVGGQALVRAAAAATVNTRLNTTATAGAIDDDGTTGAKEILGAVFAVAATGAGTFEATLTDPIVNATL